MEVSGDLSDSGSDQPSVFPPLNGSSAVPTAELAAVVAIRVGVGTVSFLSLLGASLIIFTFVAYRDLRTLARQLLVNLSIADLIVAVSHLMGLLENIDKFTDTNEKKTLTGSWYCTTQAFFSVFGTESSIFWTAAIAIYMFIVIVPQKPSIAKVLIPVFYLVCWGVPAAISVYLAVDNLLGFEPGGDPAFCGIRGTINVNSTSGETKRVVFPIIIGYDAWNYLALTVLPVLYISIRCNVKIKVTRVGRGISMRLLSACRSADLKLIFIPLIYILLRIWSVAVSIAIYYLPDEQRMDYQSSKVSIALLFLVGVCDSAQGFANSVLFCVFTKSVRTKLYHTAVKCTSCYRIWCRRHSYVVGFDSAATNTDDRQWMFASSSSSLSVSVELLHSSSRSDNYGSSAINS